MVLCGGGEVKVRHVRIGPSGDGEKFCTDFRVSGFIVVVEKGRGKKNIHRKEPKAWLPKSDEQLRGMGWECPVVAQLQPNDQLSIHTTHKHDGPF